MSLTKKELVEVADSLGLDIPESTTKAEIVKLIEEHGE